MSEKIRLKYVLNWQWRQP